MPNIFLLSKKTIHLLLLFRMHAPAGYMLCFFPASYGLILAAEGSSGLYYIVLFFIASIIMRSAGCIINDLWDRELDKNVDRTKSRPLASGKITVIESLLALCLLLLLGLAILLTLSTVAIYIGFLAMSLIVIYPLMKRITYYPQVFLGFTFNIGCLIGYATLKNTISMDAFLLYLGCVCWTVAYDSIYAFMDIEDDKKIGIKSLAILLEKTCYKYIIAGLYLLFYSIFLLVFYSILNIAGLALVFFAMTITVHSVITLNIRQRSNCLLRFKSNSWIGLLLLLAILLEKM